MNELTKKTIKFNKKQDWNQFHLPENLAKSIFIDTIELLENFQWNSNCDIWKS